METLSSIRYFPGDPPFFETVAILAFLATGALVISGVLAFLGTIPGTSRRFRRPILRFLVILTCLPAMALTASAAGISRRHFGEWADLKAMIRQYSEAVSQEVQQNGGPSNLGAIEAQLLTPPPTFRFAALPRPVHLRIMQTTPPYIGVDFGDGANAVFDPLTMICIYAD